MTKKILKEINEINGVRVKLNTIKFQIDERAVNFTPTLFISNIIALCERTSRRTVCGFFKSQTV